MMGFTYQGAKTKEISFPLGGIGSGCIGLAGNGQLIDWEIFNKPNKKGLNGFSHFAIKAETQGQVLDARVLHGDLFPPYTGKQTDYQGRFGESTLDLYGFGPCRASMAGLPHFENCTFEGAFPFASIKFRDDYFPGVIALTAFNPFIPLNDRDSSIPGALFEFDIHNTHDRDLDYTICLSVNNPHALPGRINTYQKTGDCHLIRMYQDTLTSDDFKYGDISIATDAQDASYQEYWYRSRWFDNLEVYWKDLIAPGRFINRTGDQKETKNPEEMGLLAAHLSIKSGFHGKIRFVISWNYPNCQNYWNPEKVMQDCAPGNEKTWKNFYASLFADSRDSVLYCLQEWDRLYSETLEFKNALFSSSLPPEAIEAISANLSILKSPTLLRLSDGSVYGFEGCFPDAGCCEGSCAHVWNYAYAMPFLFPKLERSMRDLDYRYNQRSDGRMSFRLQLPLGRKQWDFRACVDGQFGGVIQVYRDWKISGDTDWLRSIWDKVKTAIAYAWHDDNEDRWDPDQLGVIIGRQHHTLDMELFGPNSWLTGFYLAALKAGAEMADVLGEADQAADYRRIFTKGKEWVDAYLFNGSYYCQLINLKDRSILGKFVEGGSVLGGSTEGDYWNDESQEIKYQIGEGCVVDQVIAQWHANICGLGEIFNPEQTKKSLFSVYQFNFINSMRNHFNACRNFSLNDEQGLVICSWPSDRYQQIVPIPYAEETMTGFEYQAASHMIQEGMIEEGMSIVRGIRGRFDGEKRNPWNEFECGSNYTRAMSSYALLNAFSGFSFNMADGMIGFDPIDTSKHYFRCFWSLATAWGIVEMDQLSTTVDVIYGAITIKKFKMRLSEKLKNHTIMSGSEMIKYRVEGDYLIFQKPIEIRSARPLVIKI